MKSFITADWHLGDNRFQILGRPFRTERQMVATIIDNHNSVVSPEDKVIFVGDALYQNASLNHLKYIGQMHGEKILIRGNHDRNISDELFSQYFTSIIDEGEGIDLNIGGIDCYITHYPSGGKVDKFNLVGHIHATWKYQLNMLNVGVDAHHFFPVDLETIPFHFKAINEFYDQDVWIAYNPINREYEGKRGSPNYYFRHPK